MPAAGRVGLRAARGLTPRALVAGLAAIAIAPARAAAADPSLPPVAPVPSPLGTDGPPLPLGQPRPRRSKLMRIQRTDPRLAAAQDRALLRSAFKRPALLRGISDGAGLRSPDATVRELALTRSAAAGATTVRIAVDWSRTAVHPSFVAVDPSNPSSRLYSFARLDAIVRSAVGAGMAPLLVVSHAPAWAESQPRWPFAYANSWAPDPAALRSFATALARRYDGRFPDPARPGISLPRVRYFQAWNEPNLPRYLEPQWIADHGRWAAYAPLAYRALLNAFYAGVKAVRADDVVATAGLAPLGDYPAGSGRMSPLTFLRALLCFDARTGQRPLTCPNPPHFDALAFHPLSVGDPDRAAAVALDVSLADIAKVTGLLHRAERAGHVLPAGRKPLWVTELNWESNPPKREGVRPRLQAIWVARALHRLWVAGATLVDWQFLSDPVLTLQDPIAGAVPEDRPGGLYTRGSAGPTSDQPKPFLRGFRFPFDPLRRDREHVLVWALMPPGIGPRSVVTLQRRVRGGWEQLRRLRPDATGAVLKLVRLRGAAALRILADTGASAAASVGARRYTRTSAR